MLNLFNYLKTTLTISFICIFALNSCGIYKYSSAKDNPTNADDRIAKNMEEGRGFRLMDVGKNKGNGNFQFASANPLWRASLEILDFMPIINASYSGGIIITDWYDESGSKDSIKITIKFLSNEIRSDGLDIQVYKKNCKSFEGCQTIRDNGKIKNEIKFAIIKKAAQIEKANLAKK